MPRPASPIELLHSPSGTFPYVGWEENHRTYQFFRVLGWNERRRLLGTFDCSAVENDALVQKAKEIVLAEWGAYLPPSHSNKDGVNTIGVAQIRRVRQNNVVSFQSACVAIVALELALLEHGKSFDIYENHTDGLTDRIIVCPAIFQVDNYSLKFYLDKIEASADAKRKLQQYTLQRLTVARRSGDNVFLDMAKGQLVTEWLAQKFVSFWDPIPPPLSTISACVPRSRNEWRKASILESPVFPQ